MIGLKFSEHRAASNATPFERIFKIFSELIVHTSGDVQEALDWLEELSNTYSIFTEDYGMEEFVRDLMDKGFIQPEPENNPNYPRNPAIFTPNSFCMPSRRAPN